MRVLFWSELFWPYIGGAEVFATKLLAVLRARNYEVIVVTRQDSPDLPQEDRYQGIPIFRFPFWTAMADRNIDQLWMARRQLIKLKQAFAPDLVHVHNFGPSVLFCLDTAHAFPAPLLVTLTNELELVTEKHDLLRRLLSSAEWVTGKTAAVLAEAHRLAPQILPRSSVIHNGLAVPTLSPAPLPLAAPRLLCLGRLATQKGFDLALTAMASIKNSFPEARLIVAGDGPERPRLEQLVADLGLSHVVDFLGWVSPHRVFDLINTATMLIMPSRWEGLPSVALQAGVMARPVVGARISGLADVIVHQLTGLLVEPENASAIAAAIAALLDHPRMAAQMGEAARQRVREVFSWDGCVNAYDELWRRLTDSRRSESAI
jgi:glycogen(starch) synthase